MYGGFGGRKKIWTDRLTGDFAIYDKTKATILRGSSRTIWQGKKVSEQEFRRPHHNHLTSIKSEIDHRDDGNVLIARELSDALLAKIRWGLLTP
jgi:hypothetical protein